MAASNGADSILVLPYDLYSNNGVSELAKRMALNISLILKEESYFDKVIDPSGGSYSAEALTKLIGEKAWSYFQSIEQNEGLFKESGLNSFVNDVKSKRQERIDAFQAGNIIGIGMNKYPSPDEKEAEGVKRSPYLEIEPLVFEMESKNSLV